jgi:hypothetical protein
MQQFEADGSGSEYLQLQALVLVMYVEPSFSAAG